MNDIKQFHNVHFGKRLFILASGPSLATHDLTRLKRRIVMGLNRSVMVYPDTHYHCVMDERLFHEYEADLKKTRYLFTIEGRPWGSPLTLLGSEGFSWDLMEGDLFRIYDRLLRLAGRRLHGVQGDLLSWLGPEKQGETNPFLWAGLSLVEP